MFQSEINLNSCKITPEGKFKIFEGFSLLFFISSVLQPKNSKGV